MKKTLLALSFLIAMFVGTSTASAQIPVPSPVPATTKLAFDHDGLNTDGYKLYIDAAAGVQIQAIAVATPSPHFETAFPALTPGVHTLKVTAFNVAGDSLASNTLSVKLVVVPSGPTNLRIVLLNESGDAILGFATIERANG